MGFIAKRGGDRTGGLRQVEETVNYLRLSQRESIMLAQMLAPRPNHEHFEISRCIGDVAENSLGHGPVAAANRFQGTHRAFKVGGTRGIDAVLNIDHDGASIRIEVLMQNRRSSCINGSKAVRHF